MSREMRENIMYPRSICFCSKSSRNFTEDWKR